MTIDKQLDWNKPDEEMLSMYRLDDLALRDFDRDLKHIWNCAFPNGLKYQKWKLLMYVMYTLDGEQFPMSFRALAHNIGIMLDLRYAILLNEAYGATTPSNEEDAHIISWLRCRMQRCGYYEWLSND